MSDPNTNESSPQVRAITAHPAFVATSLDEAGKDAITNITDGMSKAILCIKVNVPGCAEQTLAIRKIEEALFWANQGIWHKGERYI